MNRSSARYMASCGKPRAVMGLATATPDEIHDLKKKYEGRGYRVVHKTHKKDGTKLPRNGVLAIS